MAVAAIRAAAGRVQGVGCEPESAPPARCRSHLKTITGRSHALLDVLQVFLEYLDGQNQIVTQIVEGPLLGP
jgi:hypothetical protein